MFQHPFSASLAGLLALCASTAAWAAPRAPFSWELRTGIGYDSNVTIEQADVITRRGDASLNLGAAARYRLPALGKISLTTGYDFDQSFYEDLTDYNLQIHNFSLSATTPLGKASLSSDYRYFHMRLGNKPFLDMHMLSPAIGSFVTRDLYMRASYSYFDKSFATANGLDAQTHALEASAYYFFQKKRGYASLAARYEGETTRDPALAYDSLQVTTRLQVATDSLLQDSKLRLGFAYRTRAYRNPTPSIGVPREEKRYSYSIGADIPVMRGFFLKPEYRHADRNSNYIFTDYSEDTASLTLLYRY